SLIMEIVVHFFFSSRRRHTRFSRDWSSDMCSSDLMHHLVTTWAYLDRSLASAFLLRWLHRSNGAMPCYVLGKVQHQAVIRVRLWPQTTACHLHIKRGRHSGPEHHDDIGIWRVKSCRQHVSVSECAYLLGFECGNHLLALALWRFSCQAFSCHALGA